MSWVTALFAGGGVGFVAGFIVALLSLGEDNQSLHEEEQ